MLFSLLWAPLGALGLTTFADVDDDVPAARFAAPIRLQAAGVDVMVDAPGYASPSRADVNEDGYLDLVVGQFNGGLMHVFHGDADGEYTPAGLLQAEGAAAEVPGVW